MSKSISKSRIMEGLVCLKKAYFSIHHPHLKAATTPQQQMVFDEGHLVGVEACKHFPGGVLIGDEIYDLAERVCLTSEAIASGANTIYEATFAADYISCRVDILHRPNQGADWHLIEVKSGTSVKDRYLKDAAAQAIILRRSGLSVGKVFAMHINSSCRYPDLSNLFTLQDVTLEAMHTEPVISQAIDQLLAIKDTAKQPNIAIGRHCESPYECDFKAQCWNKVPEYSVFDIPDRWKAFDKGVMEIEDANDSRLSPKQRRAAQAIIHDELLMDVKGIRGAFREWNGPFYYLDFETIGPAIPRYPDTGPYATVPFQASVHIQDSVGNSLTHHEYLHPDLSDPRPTLAEFLVASVPMGSGTVFAYNADFERRVLHSLAKRFPKLSEHLHDIADRLVDLLPVFRAHVYHRDFRGSFSIKEVAPALLGSSWGYSGMDVGDGKMAQKAFEEMIHPATAVEVKAKLRADLLRYCGMDTMVMVRLVEWLAGHANRG